MPLRGWHLFNLVFIITVLFFHESPAQNKQVSKKGCTITVSIIDSASGSPFELASVLLLKSEDSTYVAGAAADSNGVARLKNITPGKYAAQVSYIGYQQATISNIEVPEGVPAIKLPEVKLVLKQVFTKPVIVTAEKERIVYEDDRIIYNVEKDPANMGGSAIEVLQNAPLVRVDINGNVKMLGRKFVSIFIDGMPVNNMGSVNDVLKTIPYNDIEKIEIIQSPGIEFGSAFESGVINIIMKKETPNRYSGNASASFTTPVLYYPSASVTYKLDKGQISCRYYGNYLENNSSSLMERTTFADNGDIFLKQNQDENNKNYNSNINFTYIYRPDKDNSFSQMLISSFNDNKTKTDNVSNYIFSNNDPTRTIFNNNKSKFTGATFSYSANYTRNFQEKGRRFTISWGYSNKLFNNNDIRFNDTRTGYDSYNYRLDSYNNNKTANYYLSSFYAHPLSADNVVSLSYDMKLNKTVQRYNYWSLSGDKFVENTDNKSGQKLNEQSHQVSSSFSGKVYDFKYRLSLSAFNYIKNYSDEIKETNFNYNKWIFTPVIDVSKKLDKQNRISFRWSLTQYTPLNFQLNANNDYSDSAAIYIANKELLPEKAMSYSVDYNFNTLSTNIAAGFSYTRDWDKIEGFTIMQNNEASVTTFRNIGKSEAYNCYFNLSQVIWNIWTPELSGEISKNKEYNTLVPYKDITFSWNLFNKIVFKNIVIQTSTIYFPERITSQNKMNKIFFTNIGLKANLIEKQLFLNIGLNDIFNNQRNSSTTYGASFISYRKKHITTRTFNLGITYYFQKRDNQEGEDLNTGGSPGMEK
jgi:hypothetical protein